MAKLLTKEDLRQTLEIIQQIYLSDNIPWICGYSGGKDSSAVVQLVWMALQQLPIEKRKKAVHVISTDTLVESPVVAAWAELSLTRMRKAATQEMLPIIPHRLTPQIQNTYWVNLIGRGYPYPRPNFRWCTDRMKIDPSNQFIKSILEAESEAILVLGSRKAESSARKQVMEDYEKKRYREYLSPNGSYPNTYVLTPIENWTDSMVWQLLMQYSNPWGHSNKDLLAMYRGASADNECPLVVESGTPSCGGSRMGCWVCTMVTQDKSLAAMIQNDEEKSWMLPLLDFRNYIAAYNQEKGQDELDRQRRDFRRMSGNLTWHNDRLVHGPYKKEVREDFLRRLLRLQMLIRKTGPENVRNANLITHEELCYIRKIWLDEKHEFDDSLPRIYQEETGEAFQDNAIQGNKYYSKEEWDLLKQVCDLKYPGYELMLELQSTLLDIEAKNSALNSKKNVLKKLESEIKRAYYKDEADAEHKILERRRRQGLEPVPEDEETLPEDVE
ncbi:DNA phosphorothioation system sulfurtransferase DndC [Intestinimonas butyriciproducens]|uniref:DNA phosphorothioation system sulfurtransferase DndC n=1 Tax=Intestinimonas butyriciproducens TaxID=1297617 RepID=UPI0019596C1B|nr:DNA phosphorothioation system sulfurtransferase DndC [Intestinimonas butyriciproducens]MBM6918899.1 DNA phosphorothioation system sulfurtransferase DndC [Intestinimonas butyriciproducens]